jgi:hypothetical protein
MIPSGGFGTDALLIPKEMLTLQHSSSLHNRDARQIFLIFSLWSGHHNAFLRTLFKRKRLVGTKLKFRGISSDRYNHVSGLDVSTFSRNTRTHRNDRPEQYPKIRISALSHFNRL